MTQLETGEVILVIGSGGREHALAWSLSKSPLTEKVFVAPGNGLNSVSHPKIECISLKNKGYDFEEILGLCRTHNNTLVVVGPEAPLAEGIVDYLQKFGIKVFGPSKAAAQLEASKAFSKQFMVENGIPTAEHKSFTDIVKAKAYVEACSRKVVIKASGLAAGKGVLLPESKQEALEAIDHIMKTKAFGNAGDEIVIEERLDGEEVSVFAFTDGYSIALLSSAQDHKRALDGDHGLNTGGMGAYAPTRFFTNELKEQVKEQVFYPVLKGMRKQKTPYVGVLYAGLLLDKTKGLQVIEFNCRLGDPETQVVLPLVKSDLVEIVRACVDGYLDTCKIELYENTYAATVVMASPGYPSTYPKDLPLEIPAPDEDTLIFHAGTKYNVSTNELRTNGGRVLAVTGIAQRSLENAITKAYAQIEKITFDKAHYRKDIGAKGLVSQPKGPSKSLYAQAGVDIEAGNQAVAKMKKSVELTYGPEVLCGLGSFGGLFDFFSNSYVKDMKEPVLVASTDGVGTKIRVAAQLEIYTTIGQDIVNHCINDILVQGALPLFFLDYFAASHLNPSMCAEVVQGAARACQQVGCALLGGETAEMPGVYCKGEFDLAGTIVGVVDKSKVIDGTRIVPGDVVFGIPSNGLHTNGYSLARRILAKFDWTKPRADLNGQTIGDILLTPHRAYLKEFHQLTKAQVDIKGLVHVTGGGLIENPPRILPSTACLQLQRGAWPLAPIFDLLQREGGVTNHEMAQVFNQGLGLLVFVKQDQAHLVASTLPEVYQVGKVVSRTKNGPPVYFAGTPSWIPRSLSKSQPLRVGVFGSTRGTDFQFLLEAIAAKQLPEAEFHLVVSNRKQAGILQRAQDANIPAVYVPCSKATPREEYDAQLTKVCEEYQIDLILLIGFMRILSPSFVRRWAGACLNVHPSLLPAFAGGMDMDVHQQVLDAKVPETGCTVHMVEEQVDHGQIVVQKRVTIDSPTETAATLKRKVQQAEGQALLEAIKLWYSNDLSLASN